MNGTHKKLRPWIPAMVLMLLLPMTASAGERWLHVRVEEGGADGERVSVNIPLSIIESVLPLIDVDELAANEDDNETTASIAYRRELTSDWSMLTGYEYTRDDNGDDENSIFLNIQRDITFGF